MLHAARTVVAFGIILQAAGLAKLLVIAAFFGAGPELDAYYLALVIPTFLTGLSAGILQSSFIPLYIDAKARGDGDAARRLRNGALTWTGTILGSVALMCTIAQHPIVQVVGSGTHPEVGPALQRAFVVLIWTAPLNGLADAIGLLMNAERRFVAGASAPVVNVIVSVLMLALWPDLEGLVWGLLAGLWAQIIVIWFAAHRAGLRLRLEIDASAILHRSVLVLALPVIISILLGNFVPAFIQLMAGRAGIGAVSAMGYAGRLHNSVVQSIVMSISLVLLPHFAWLISQRKHGQLRQTLERVFAATLVFFVASLAFVAAAGSSVVRILLERGEFTRADGELVAQVWLAFTAGLVGATWGIFLARLFQALQQPWLIARLAIVSVIANVSLTLLLMPRWGVVGIAIANSIAYVIVMGLFHRLARRELGPLLTAVSWRFMTTVFVVNVIAYGVALLWAALLDEATSVLVVAGQFMIIVSANLLLARASPLNLQLRALLRK